LFKLKKVELLGFKSFADRTRLEFGDGTVAIVGPNGCGKSNLADAVSWVLGEQSARSLRGERMADVIFNGTSKRPPTGMAEASVTLIDPEYAEAVPGPAPEFKEPACSPAPNGEAAPSREPREAVEAPPTTDEPAGENGGGSDGTGRRPPLQHRAREITVTRRLFRSGESEYLINGEVCRLRDIQDLFMGTGLGPESYAIIEQGRIGQILSSKPSDRRAILEEAAGVSKFKTRKRLAEAKLESSRLNLARISDILTEVSKQMGSLKRQAARARRYREMQEELRGRLKVVLTARLLALEAECRRLREDLTSTQQDCSQAAQQLEELEREEKAVRLQHEELEGQLTLLRQALALRDLEKERLHSRTEQLREQAASLRARAEEASTESRALEAQLAALELEAAKHACETEQVREEWHAAQEAALRLLARRDEVAAQLADRENALEACRQALLSTVSRAADLRNQLAKAEEIELALDRQCSRLQSEEVTLEQERAQLAAEFDASGLEEQREQGALTELGRSFSETSAGLERARAEESRQRAELEALRRELSTAAARKQALEESLGRHAYTTETVRRLLAAPIPINGHHFRPLGVLADFLEVSPGYEEVVEEFLKAELDYVVVERPEEARSGIALLKTEGSGRSTFFVTQIPAQGRVVRPPNGGEGTGDAILNIEGALIPLKHLVRFEARLGLNGDLPLPALGNTYLVEDAASAERLAAAHPECHFLTPSGDHYHHRLVSGGRGASAGPLALRRDCRDLERQTTSLETALRSAETAVAEVSERAVRLDGELRHLTAAKLEAEKKAVVSSERLRQLRQALERAAERLDVLRQEATSLGEERETVRARQGSLRAELESAAEEQTRGEQEISRIAGAVRELRGQGDQLAHDLAQAQARSSALEERTRAAEADESRLQARQQEVGARVSRLGEQCASWQQEQEQLAGEGESARARLNEIETEQETAREELARRELESQSVRARRDELGPRIDSARWRVESLRERRSRAEVALARAESDHAHAAQQCREELKAEPSALLAELSASEVAESLSSEEALEGAERELQDLKARLENLGPVNMMALEELEEAEERSSFLETQRQDLLASIDDTVQAIREIDQVSRQLFLEAFQAINAYFAESFQTLFGGGNGQMRLSDQADPESGIDIVAQPPGKRLQNILLLSGGEKALAALALLIAVFRYTPSPFCVLDEVDAPLDESNVDRFTRLIRQMSRQTQFILMTHSKRTMEIAQVLYGVTMEEPGVSKLVSVRFDEVRPEPVAISAQAGR
jgi:chromosome segregation protein